MRKRLTLLILTVIFPVTISASIALPGVYKPAQPVVCPGKAVLVFDCAGPLYDFTNSAYHYLETPDEAPTRLQSRQIIATTKE